MKSSRSDGGIGSNRPRAQTRRVNLGDCAKKRREHGFKMKSVPMPVKVLPIVLGILAVVIVGGVGRVRNQAAEKGGPRGALGSPQPTEIPPCSGDSPKVSLASVQGKPHPHSATLSWKPAVAASTLPRDAIQGYYVYRSLASQSYTEANRMSESPLHETQCVDTAVEPGKTYYYVVKTVTEGGKRSVFSTEIKVVVPFP
jgi:hypothetical protein